jgi:hypothetical protein
MKKLVALSSVLIIGASVFVAAPAQASPKNDRLYVKVLKAEAPILSSVKAVTLIKSGKLTCKYLRSGASLFDAVEVAEEAGLDNDTTLSMVAAAVVFFCPEQENNF